MNILISSMIIKIKIMLNETPAEQIVGLSYELSVIRAVGSSPGHFCDNCEGQVAQHPQRSISGQS
jgi:hypothetical protein